MAKSKVNYRFLWKFLAITVVVIGLGGFFLVYQRYMAPERNFAAGQRFEQEGDYRKAVQYYGRASNKQQTNLKFLDAMEGALMKLAPTTRDEAAEYYNQLLGVRQQRSRAVPNDPASAMKAMQTLFDRNDVFGQDILWREFTTEAERVGARLPAGDPIQNQLKFWRAVGFTRRGTTISDADRAVAEQLLREVFAENPAMDDAWFELAQSQAESAEKFVSDNRTDDAIRRFAELDATIAAAEKASPDGMSWRILKANRLTRLLDRNEQGVTAADVEKAREAVAAMAPSVIGDRGKTFRVAVEMLGGRTNDWLKRTILVLRDRVKHDPNDMVARRVLMQAATSVDPVLALEIAEETRAMPNVPLSVESLIQNDAVTVAVVTMFDSEFERWRIGKTAEERKALLPTLKAMKDEAVKYLESIGEKNHSTLVQAKAALADGRIAEAVAMFDGLLHGQVTPPSDTYLYAAYANLLRREPGTAMLIANEGMTRYPAFTPLLMMRAEIEAGTGKYAEALATYKAVLAREPGNKAAIEQVEVLGGMEVTAAGAADAGKGDDIAILLGTAERKLMVRDVDGAVLLLNEALKLNPNDLRVIVAMAQVYTLLKEDPVQANQWIEKGLKIQGNEERLIQFKAMLASTDPVDRALESVRLQYPQPEAQAVQTYLILVDMIERLQERIDSPATTPEGKAMAPVALARAKGMLQTSLDAALKANPRDETLLERAALEAIKAKDWDAVERFARTAEEVGENGIAATLRSRIFLAQGDTVKALAIIEDARKAGHDSPMLLRQAALMYERAGKLADAKDAMEAAYKRRPSDITIGRLYAQLLDRTGDRDQALRILRELARANPSSRETLTAWLDVESEVGDRTGASAMRRRLYKDAPGFRENSLALAKMLVDAPSDLSLMVDADGKQKFTMAQLQTMPPLKRQQELQHAAKENLDLGLDILRFLQQQDPGNPVISLTKARAIGRFNTIKDGEDSIRADIAALGTGPTKGLWISLGAFVAESGRPEQAAIAFAEARKQQEPGQIDVDLQVADFWFSRQQWARARTALEPIVLAATGADQANFATRLAEICQNLRDYEASDKYADLAEKAGGSTNATLAMIRAANLIGRGESMVGRGEGEQGTETFMKSIEAFRKATDMAPNGYIAWTGLADAQRGMYLRTRDTAYMTAAEASINKALSIMANYMPAIRVKKELLIDRNDLAGAIVLIEGLVKAEPQSLDARRILIDLLARANETARAVAVAEDAAQLEPRSPEWPILIGGIYQLADQMPNAIAAFDRAFSTDPTEDTLIRGINARLQGDEPDWAGIVTILRANPRLVSNSPTLQGALAAGLSNTKQRDAGMQALRNAYGSIRSGVASKIMQPTAWDVWFISVGQSFKDQPQEAEAFVKGTLGNQPADFYANRGLARIWRSVGKVGLDKSLMYFDQAIQSANDNHELAGAAAIEAGETAYLFGECQRSLPLFEKAISLQPTAAPTLNNAAYVTAKCGTGTDQAVTWARKAVELAPQIPDFQDTLGYCLLRAGKPNEALSPLQKSLTIAPSVSNILHLTQALQGIGRKDEAKATFGRLGKMKLSDDQIVERDAIEKTLQ